MPKLVYQLLAYSVWGQCVWSMGTDVNVASISNCSFLLTIVGQQSCPGIQSPCTSTQQPTLIPVALVPSTNQALLQATAQAGYPNTPRSDRLIASSTESLNSIITPCQQHTLMRPSSTDHEDYSYPNLRLQHHNQHTSDGYVIVQPDLCVRENTQDNATCADVESCGARGAMDDTL